jgi:hypothetical protein
MNFYKSESSYISVTLNLSPINIFLTKKDIKNMNFHSRFNLIFIFIIFSFSLTSAQTEINIAETHRSTIIKPKKKSIIRAGITSGEHGYYLLEVVNIKTANIITEAIKGKYRLFHYDKSLELLQTKDLDILVRTYKGKIEYIDILDKDLLIFAWINDRKLNKKHLYQYTHDPITLEQIQEPTIVHESAYIGYNRDRNKFNFALSPDSSKFLIYETNPLQKGKMEILAKVFDTKMNLLWSKKNTSDKLYYRFHSSTKAVVSNNGDSFFLISNSYMIAMNDNNNDWIKLRERDKNQIKCMEIQLDHEQNPIILGYYSHKKNKEDGLVFIKSAKLNDPFELSVKLTPFSEKILKLNSKKQNPKKNPGLRNATIKKVFRKPNNNFLIIGEENYSDDHNSGSGGSKQEYKTYYHKSLLISEVDLRGNIVWSQKIPKHGGGGKFYEATTFSTHQDGEIFYFIFNDHPNNLNYPGYGKITKTKKLFNREAHVTVARLDNDGKFKTASLFPSSKEKFQKFYPLGTGKISNKEMLIIERKEREFELVKLKIEE